MTALLQGRPDTREGMAGPEGRRRASASGACATIRPSDLDGNLGA